MGQLRFMRGNGEGAESRASKACGCCSLAKLGSLSAADYAPPPMAGSGDQGQTIAGWGNIGVPGHEVLSERLERASRDAVLSRGLGRSYGDSALPPPDRREVLGTRMADRVLSFDAESGRLRAEAGLSLHELNRLFLRRGYFTPVTPGTQFVTLGGMVAADVHGKNHHVAGCFGSDHTRALRLRVADGQVLEITAESHPDLFYGTCGGMGLTGHILEVEIDLKRIESPWIYSQSRRIGDIDEFLVALQEYSARYPYVVGWIDCLSRGRKMGRGILDGGRFATASEAGSRPLPGRPSPSVPLMFPRWVLSDATAKAFNTLYYWKHLAKEREGLRHPDAFFYPLDAIRHWNRIYGRSGFTQYQCVIPEEAGRDGVVRFFEALTAMGGASFLCVIKSCGPESKGMLSFPKRGTTIALDIPVRAGTQALVDALNRVLLAEGGRIYLAKDTFTRAEDFRRMEPRLRRFEALRDRWDPERKLRSAQSVRLFGDPVRSS